MSGNLSIKYPNSSGDNFAKQFPGSDKPNKYHFRNSLFRPFDFTEFKICSMACSAVSNFKEFNDLIFASNDMSLASTIKVKGRYPLFQIWNNLKTLLC
jgi:hypothetical protein